MALLNQFTPVQGDNGAAFDIELINNDTSTTYESGVLSIDGILGDVADAVIAKNSNYSGFTRNQIMSEWGFSLRDPPTGEVSSGWSAALDGNNNLQISHGIFGVTPWTDTTQNSGNQDLMVLTLSIPKSQLDFNHNDVFDAATESLYKTEIGVTDAFTATTVGGGTRTGDGQAYTVVPEPATMGLLVGGLVGLLAVRKLKKAYRLA